MSEVKDSHQFDLIIVGAGMVGASLVHLLAPAIEQGLKIALIDRQPITLYEQVTAEQLPPSFDGRATAISYGTAQILENINVWPRLVATACAIEHIQVSDKGRFGQTHLHAQESSVPAFGYICANRDLGFALLSGLPKSLTTFAEQSVAQVQMVAQDGQSQAQVFLADGQKLTAQLLVMADGGRSPLVQQLGIRQQRQSYNAHAIVTSIRMSEEHNGWAYERFSPAGPIALLPMHGKKQRGQNANNELAVVWTVADDLVEQTLALPEQEFIQQLQKMIGHRAGKIEALGERVSYPLALQQASEQVRPNLVLLGNAAHALHPVAGQGFNLALRDASILAEKIMQAFAEQQPIGQWSLLKEYFVQQQQDQKNTISASDLLPTLFSSTNPLLKFGRGAGLLAMMMTPTLRYLFSRHAMGLAHKAAKL